MRHANPAAPLQTVLDPIADLFGTRVEQGEGGMVRVTDEARGLNCHWSAAAPVSANGRVN